MVPGFVKDSLGPGQPRISEFDPIGRRMRCWDLVISRTDLCFVSLGELSSIRHEYTAYITPDL